jgi:hypothetical protein
LGFEEPLMFYFFWCGFRNGRFGFGNEGLDWVGTVFDVISKESSPPLGGLVFKKELELFLEIGLLGMGVDNLWVEDSEVSQVLVEVYIDGSHGKESKYQIGRDSESLVKWRTDCSAVYGAMVWYYKGKVNVGRSLLIEKRGSNRKVIILQTTVRLL